MTDALKITARTLPLIDSGGGCACCSPAPAASERVTGTSGEQTPSAETAAFEVGGMTCGHCVAHHLP